MDIFKKKHKQLWKAHSKRLKKLRKTSYKSAEGCLEYFVAQLSLLRDYYIMIEPLETNGEANMKIMSLATAVHQYGEYVSCASQPKSEEQQAKAALHWECFWSLVAAHMKEW